MARWFGHIAEKSRIWVQICFAAVSNGYVKGFFKGEIYTGPLKTACVPGLNCYSCPGALGSCPIGALQSVLGSRDYHFSYYIVGFLFVIGALAGRLVCGWICPFGLIQDLLFKVPFFRKINNLPGHKVLRYLKYFLLAVTVVILPMFYVDLTGQGEPWFCQYICPAGTLQAGVPLVLSNPSLQAAVGFLYRWKLMILIVVITLSVVVYRPFCKYLCPLGAIYGLFNPIAFWRYEIDQNRCTDCGSCSQVCKMGVDVRKNFNRSECIRCGDCLKACKAGALHRKK